MECYPHYWQLRRKMSLWIFHLSNYWCIQYSVKMTDIDHILFIICYIVSWTGKLNWIKYCIMNYSMKIFSNIKPQPLIWQHIQFYDTYKTHQLRIRVSICHHLWHWSYVASISGLIPVSPVSKSYTLIYQWTHFNVITVLL